MTLRSPYQSAITPNRMPASTHSTEARRKTDRAEQEAAQRRQADEDFVAVMSQPWGRRVVWRLVQGTDGRQVCFSSNNTVCISYTALRDFGRAELTDRAMALCPELWLVMHTENR